MRTRGFRTHEDARRHRRIEKAAAGGGGRKENTVNYEVDNTVSMKRQASGNIKRINAAVLVNHRSSNDAKGKTTTTALTPEDGRLVVALREPMHALYSNAVGKDHRLLAEWFDLEPAVELLPKGARLAAVA